MGDIAGPSLKFSFMLASKDRFISNRQALILLCSGMFCEIKICFLLWLLLINSNQVGLIFWDWLYQWSRYSAREVRAWFLTNIYSLKPADPVDVVVFSKALMVQILCHRPVILVGPGGPAVCEIVQLTNLYPSSFCYSCGHS